MTHLIERNEDVGLIKSDRLREAGGERGELLRDGAVARLRGGVETSAGADKVQMKPLHQPQLHGIKPQL